MKQFVFEDGLRYKTRNGSIMNLMHSQLCFSMYNYSELRFVGERTGTWIEVVKIFYRPKTDERILINRLENLPKGHYVSYEYFSKDLISVGGREEIPDGRWSRIYEAKMGKPFEELKSRYR